MITPWLSAGTVAGPQPDEGRFGLRQCSGRSPSTRQDEARDRCPFRLTFTVEEFSPGGYRVEGRDLDGRSVSLTGTDPEKLLAAARAWAVENAHGLPRPDEPRD